ncbi:DUF2259 domain-containing protein [Deinococcus cellulosilyticus]|uniref:DUF2259 domain-containing protein n=1 Tax=Deinococcus cellulosilyticus (strain DSM 18568 / NBRC 106333 / KACC 11606 / 5516J-15) TaxID=1223518 RepID=A0A511MWX0_DEIC1|nr:DUF2259 domain-containing protein [Deinococcus cellulosilyticus]GEM45074.1 hypothetical protein DC3_07090 [Deinococcus cellulosilyticus NBRC 106333 = KACC 11606]
MRFLLGIFLLTAGSAFAADQSTLQFLGFSKDGKYAAYEQYGIHDGSGFPFSEIVVLNVPQNKAILTVKKSLQEDGAEVKDARSQALKAATLNKYGILKTRLGRSVYANPLGKTSVQFQAKQKAYTMSVQPIPFKVTDCINPTAKGVSVQLNKKVIFKDIALPKDRICPQKYGIHQMRVWDSSKSFVAFIRYEKDGFEGPDVRYWAVSGILP